MYSQRIFWLNILFLTRRTMQIHHFVRNIMKKEKFVSFYLGSIYIVRNFDHSNSRIRDQRTDVDQWKPDKRYMLMKFNTKFFHMVNNRNNYAEAPLLRCIWQGRWNRQCVDKQKKKKQLQTNVTNLKWNLPFSQKGSKEAPKKYRLFLSCHFCCTC